MSNPTDPEASTVSDEDVSLSEEEGEVTDEMVRNMLDTVMPDQDVRRVQLLEAVREYLEHPEKPFKTVERMAKDLSDTDYLQYLKHPLDFTPTSEEVREAFNEYREDKEEKERQRYPWRSIARMSEDDS